ncbi:hypothetical protein [Acrocarpospora sp. B8E8]
MAAQTPAVLDLDVTIVEVGAATQVHPGDTDNGCDTVAGGDC